MITEGIYSATIWHKRFIPIVHKFNYTQLMVAIDLDTPQSMIPHNRRSILSLRDRDHFPESSKSLKDNIQAMLPEKIIREPHRIILLTQLAHFGFCFNPISFFAITTLQRDRLLGLILEVHNTPWGERHYYPLYDFESVDGVLHTHFQKELHVSPFLPMDFIYDFSFEKNDDKLIIKMENWQQDEKHFAAGIALQHHPLEPANIRKQFLRHPFSPHKTVAAIYWHALQLWLKGVPFCSHPKLVQK